MRWFGSTEALSQHNEAKHRNSPAVVPFQNQLLTVSTPQPLQQFHFRDQNYQGFPLLDSSLIYDNLIPKCHSSERLTKEGYFLGGEARENAREAALRKETIISPYPDPLRPKRKAVALHCEMVGVRNGDSEIISICAIDFFTGEFLLDSLVKPQAPVIQLRTDIHGIRPATLSKAVSQGQVLHGWESARQQLFKHINTETVLVGQSLQHDLKRLRVSHMKIFDTAIVTAEAVYGTDADFGHRWSLQSLCAGLFKLRIQQGPSTHCALEDAMAAREVALWCICCPDKLEQWAKRERKKDQIEKAKQAGHGQNVRWKGFHYYDFSKDDVAVPPWKEVDKWTWPTGH
jgi:DNA polymerase III epsilon subunit-like protein